MTPTTIWLRAESKPSEERTALTPANVKRLTDAGFRVVVEESVQSAIDTSAYEGTGCEFAAEGSWVAAPQDAFILGLKELPEADTPLTHRHIYFAHAYKEQAGWESVLSRFTQGDGTLYDLEFLVDENKRRIAAFGYWAGFTGAAVGLMTWCGQQAQQQPPIKPLSSYKSQQDLVASIRQQIEALPANKTPRFIVIGARGRCGSGAVQLAKDCGCEVTEWDIAETAKGGPFEEIIDHDIFVNCVLINQPLPPFVTQELVQSEARQLSVIADVSCDPYGDYNPIPIYSECTTFDAPSLPIISGENPLDLIAIDHLPSMLPVEASEDFSDQLTNHLLGLDDTSKGVWPGAEQLFHEKSKHLR